MKKTLRTLLMGIAALLAGTALTSCSNDDELQTAPEGKKGYVEFSLSRGADTRTAYELTSGNGLNVTWSEDDKMVVFFTAGENKIIEVFDLVRGAGTQTAIFAKKDSQLADQSGSVVLEYIPGFTSETDPDNYTLDISNQEGNLDNLGKYDIFAYEATLNNGKIESPEFAAFMAILHFPKDFDFGITATKANLVIGGGYNKIGTKNNTKGNITVKDVSLTGGKLNDDIYVAVLKFLSMEPPTTLTVGDKTFALPEIEAAGMIYNFAESNLREVDTTPLTIEPKSSGVIVTIHNPLGLAISYKMNDGVLSTSTVGDANDIMISVPVGDKLQLFGDNPSYTTSSTAGYTSTNIECSDECYIYGNIMSLVYLDDFALQTKLTGANTFVNLFKDNTKIQNYETKALTLPATTLTQSCYVNMFYGCTGLTKAPVLPATTLTDDCYSHMFKGCTGLTEAPELPATELAAYCYSSMFKGCTGLTEAPELPATKLEEYCYAEMFYDCTKLTKGPSKLPANQLAEYCCYDMFYKCSSLTEAPELPATELAESCYYLMFAYCSNLTKAPELPATKLASYCYNEMFMYCTSLTTAPLLPATDLVDYCYSEMFVGCANLNAVTCLATTKSNNFCTWSWLYGVAMKGTFTKAADSTIWATNSENGIPSGWIVVDYTE